MSNDPYQLHNAAGEIDTVDLQELSARLAGLRDAGGEELRAADVARAATAQADSPDQTPL